MHSLNQKIYIYYGTRKCMVWCGLLFMLITSCRREARDTTPPLITITSPSSGQTFYFQNTIPISALVSDETRLESVVLEITNSHNNRIFQSHEFLLAEKEQHIEWSISHDDLYLPSGTYFVKISASDGENTDIAFQEIYLIEAARTLEHIFLVRPGATSTAIDSLPGAALMPWINYPGNYAFGGIDSRTNQWVACSTSPSELSSQLYPDLEQVPGPFPPSSYELTSFYHDKDFQQFIWGNNAGQILMTDLIGSRLFSYVQTSGAIKCIAATSVHLIVISESLTSGNNYIDVYPRSIGIPALTLAVDWEIVGAIPLPSDEQVIILAGNSNGSAHFAYLNLNTGAINENFNFCEPSPVSSICAADGNDFYAVQANGIVRYINNFSSYTVNEIFHPQKLIYDDLNHALWAIDATGVHQLDETATYNNISVTIPGVADLWLKYNK